MLKKENRLLKNDDFKKVFERGKAFKGGFLVIKSALNNKKFSRFGFVVSLKVSKKAVERNRIKRILREVFKKRINKIKGGFDIVVISLPGIEKQNHKKIEETIEILLKESKLLNV